MSFCPQCGAPTTQGLAFCTACGRTLAATAPAPPPSAYAAPPPPAGAPGRPLGRPVEPWIVVLLAVVTLNIYSYVFWWRVSREMDAYGGARASPLVRIGIGLVVAAVVMMGFLYARALPAMFSSLLADPPDPTAGDRLAAAIVRDPLYLLATAAQIAGTFVLYTGLGRAWQALARAETELGRRDPAPASTFLGIGYAGVAIATVSAIVGYFYTASTDPMGIAISALVGVVGLGLLVATLWVMHATQKRMNELWQANAPRGWP